MRSMSFRARLTTICLFLWFANGVPLHIALAQGYRLGAGDVLSVTVLRHPEMSVEQVTIASSGRINLPVAGNLLVTGRTIPEVQGAVRRALQVRLLRPEVTVTLRQARPQQVFLLGDVKSPGGFELKPGWRVSEVLALAGGLSVRPELAGATLTRAGQTARSLDVAQIFNNSNSPDNALLSPGDTLRFFERTLQVSVAGQVQKPGRYSVPPGATVIDALIQAGGALPKSGLSKATLERANGDTVPIDLFRVITQGERELDVKLQAGDMLVIPESNARIALLGAVQKPGFVEIDDGRSLRLAEAVALSGGVSPRAALTRATIKRANGATVPVDLYKVLVMGQQDDNIALQSGDVVTVPESRGVTVLGAVEKPGTYFLEEGSAPRMTDVLALAGGLSIKPELARITIARRPANGAVRTSSVDPVSLLELKDLTQNEPVRDGDLITVSAAKTQTVVISGEVIKPGPYELQEGESVSELIARAGGTTPLASLQKVSVVERDGTSQIVNIDAAVGGNGAKSTLPLRAGDFVVVPKNEARVLVMQAVARPGYYPIPENGVLTLGEAIVLAGGPKDRARIKEVAILRQTAEGVQRRIISLDKTYNGQLATNVTLLNGDVVYVPDGKTSGSALPTILGSLGALSTLFGVRRR